MCGHSVWKQPAYNGKNPPTHYFIKPINHKQSLRMSCFRLSLCARHWGEKVPPICDALWLISINTALREKMRSARVIYNSTKEALCCVLGCTNEHRSLHNRPPSEPRTLCLNFIFEGNIPEKKSVTSHICLGINTNASCTNVSSRQSKYHAFVFQIAFLKELLVTLWGLLLNLSLSLCVCTDAAFKCYQNDRE